MKHIQLLDCTLRDGGHINNSTFGQDVIKAILGNLLSSGIDIIEAGFLQDCTYDPDRAMYNNIEEAKRILPPKTENTRFALMGQADLYDWSKLEQCDGTVEVVRVSFHDFHIEEGFEACRQVVEKGYQCFVNPINVMGYSDEQLIAFCKRVNELRPYGFTMVDTFGAMQKQDLMRIYHILDHNLDKGIRMAVHLHENQSLSYSLAQNFIDINSPSRDICIDGSLYGMGRVPGNLCIELIMKYMNENQGTSYDIEPVYDAIDEYIMEIKRRNPWGYSIAYALSAQHKVHRTYAEYLMNQGRLKTKQINQILSQIEPEHKTRYDKAYIEHLYAAYQSHSIEDSKAREDLQQKICTANECSLISEAKVLILAPGPNIREYADRVKEYANSFGGYVISANFIWDGCYSNAAFFSNIRRYESFTDKNNTRCKIITSNLCEAGLPYDIAVNYSDYAYYKDQIADNCILMLLRLLQTIGVKKVSFAGFDGFKAGNNFAMPQMEREADHSHDNELTKEVLSSMKNIMEFEFVTPSIYEEEI